MTAFLPFALPSIGDEEIAEVVATLRSGWLTSGERCKRFEEGFARMVGVAHALAVNSATAGLHLALEAVGVKPGNKVVTSVFTFTATAEVARHLGAEVEFVDIDRETLNLDVKLLQECLQREPNIKAIIPVHLAGQACEMGPILQMATRLGIPVVDDAAHAFPCTYNRSLIGSLAHVSVFSFYATKPMTTGEGGMIVTANREYWRRMATMRLHGISRDVFDRYRAPDNAWFYEVVAPGYKYNMTDVAAAVGIHQLQKAWGFQKRRERIAQRYTEALSGLPIDMPYVAKPHDVHAWHLYIIKLKLENLTITRDEFIATLARLGIGASVHFIPLHIHPYWRDRYSFKPESFPRALDAYRRVISLPIYPGMADSDVERVIDAVRTICVSHMK